VLIASDAMTRGMDVEGVAQVVNYDAPVYAKTYVHRCGRTARAGRAGGAFTLLRKQVLHAEQVCLEGSGSVEGAGSGVRVSVSPDLRRRIASLPANIDEETC